MCMYVNIWLSAQFSPWNLGLGHKSFDSSQQFLRQQETLPIGMGIMRTFGLYFFPFGFRFSGL